MRLSTGLPGIVDVIKSGSVKLPRTLRQITCVAKELAVLPPQQQRHHLRRALCRTREAIVLRLLPSRGTGTVALFFTEKRFKHCLIPVFREGLAECVKEKQIPVVVYEMLTE